MFLKKPLFSVFIFMALFLSSVPVLAAGDLKGDQFEIKRDGLYYVASQASKKIELPGRPVAVHVCEDTLYVALGEEGMAVVTQDPSGQFVVSKIVDISHGRVTGFMVTDDTVWMQVDSTTAVKISKQRSGLKKEADNPVIITKPLPNEQTVQKQVTSETPVDAPISLDEPIRILEFSPGIVKLNIGSRQGLKTGDKLQVVRLTQIEKGKKTAFEGEVLVAVLVVEALNTDNSLARIWRGDRLLKTDTIEPIEDNNQPSLIYPRHLTHLLEIEGVVRPIIKIGGNGFGALCNLSLSWWGKNYFFNLRMHPLGFGKSEGSSVVINSLLLEGGYNSRAFAVGMGIGMASTNGDVDAMLDGFVGASSDVSASADDDNEPQWQQSTKHAFSLSQAIRLGAKDGLNFTVQNLLIYHNSTDDDDSGFIYAGTNGKFKWPLAQKVDMFMEGGGGVMGYFYATLGVFTWLRGNGDGGSIGLLASAGAAGIWGSRWREDYGDDEVFIAGPMISLGIRARLGFLKQ